MKELQFKMKGFRDMHEVYFMITMATCKKEDADKKEEKMHRIFNWAFFNGKKKWLKHILNGGEYIDFSNRCQSIGRDYPRLTSLVIAFSDSYATPSTAAMILGDVQNRQENWCEWLYSCWDKNPTAMLKAAIKNRHHYKGNMYYDNLAEAQAKVVKWTTTDKEPLFASKF